MKGFLNYNQGIRGTYVIHAFAFALTRRFQLMALGFAVLASASACFNSSASFDNVNFSNTGRVASFSLAYANGTDPRDLLAASVKMEGEDVVVVDLVTAWTRSYQEGTTFNAGVISDTYFAPAVPQENAATTSGTNVAGLDISTRRVAHNIVADEGDGLTVSAPYDASANRADMACQIQGVYQGRPCGTTMTFDVLSLIPNVLGLKVIAYLLTGQPGNEVTNTGTSGSYLFQYRRLNNPSVSDLHVLLLAELRGEIFLQVNRAGNLCDLFAYSPSDNKYYALKRDVPRDSDTVPVFKGFVEFDSSVYFVKRNAATGKNSLHNYRSGLVVEDLSQAYDTFTIGDVHFPATVFAGKLYFAADNGSTGANVKLFRLSPEDGNGIVSIDMISASTGGGAWNMLASGTAGQADSEPFRSVVYNGRLMFAAADYHSPAYTTDPNLLYSLHWNGVVPVITPHEIGFNKNAQNGGFSSRFDPQFTVVGDYLYFYGIAKVDAVASAPKTIRLLRFKATGLPQAGGGYTASFQRLSHNNSGLSGSTHYNDFSGVLSTDMNASKSMVLVGDHLVFVGLVADVPRMFSFNTAVTGAPYSSFRRLPDSVTSGPPVTYEITGANNLVKLDDNTACYLGAQNGIGGLIYCVKPGTDSAYTYQINQNDVVGNEDGERAKWLHAIDGKLYFSARGAGGYLRMFMYDPQTGESDVKGAQRIFHLTRILRQPDAVLPNEFDDVNPFNAIHYGGEIYFTALPNEATGSAGSGLFRFCDVRNGCRYD
ncbi:MAG: hypothetical protein AB7F66_02240 [Bacteriovoracia bacterium]